MNTGYKLQKEQFLDVSDYARPVAVWIAKKLRNTALHAWHLTLFHLALSIVAAVLIAQNEFALTVAGVTVLLLKNVLDSADGSLARLQDRPSVVGRFLDSDADFIGNALLFAVLPAVPAWLKCIGLLSFLLQGSFYNYYSILYRNHFSGENTSRIHETPVSPYPYDNLRQLKILFGCYKFFYLWQDKIVDAIETKILQQNRAAPSKIFLTLLSFHGQGFQHLAIIMLLLFGTAHQIPLYFIGMNVHLVLMLVGRVSYARFQLFHAKTLPKADFSVQ